MLNRHPLESYSAYLDGHCLSDAEVVALRAWIAVDERNATEFIEFAILHAAVTERLRLGRLLDDLASHRSGGGITPALVAEAIREIETNSPRVVVPLPPAEPVAERESPWRVAAPFAAVAALLLVGFWGLWQAGEVVTLPKAQEPPAIAEAKPVVPEPPKIAARLSTSFDADWVEGATAAVGQELIEGSRLNLLSGVIKLEMLGGAAVVVEGPSELQLTGPDSLRLTSGKAAVQIGEGSNSFVVNTPTLQVVDLGTEFGVQTSAAGDGQVMVFDGIVALAEPTAPVADDPSADPLFAAPRIGAGFQLDITPEQQLDADSVQPEVLSNPRHFLRPDEIDVRLRALAGSLADKKLAAHYERQRLEGLLAYQGFDAASGGSEYTLGTGGWGLHAMGRMEFVADRGGSQGGIDVQGGPVFMGLDASATGPFGRAGLIADSGRIGRTGQEVWLMWRTQRMKTDPASTDSAGLSLMFGERSDDDEPAFFGRGYGDDEAMTAQTAWSQAPPPGGERINAKIDFDLNTGDVQERPVDDKEHAWLARVEFREGADAVSVWVDPDLENLDLGRPQAYLEAVQIEFDRIRMAVNRAEEVWRFSEFAAATDPEVLSQLSKVAKFQVDQ